MVFTNKMMKKKLGRDSECRIERKLKAHIIFFIAILSKCFDYVVNLFIISRSITFLNEKKISTHSVTETILDLASFMIGYD